MKQLAFILFFLVASKANSCPACNIHNYLHSSLNASTLIYRGKIVKVENEETIVEVLEIIRAEGKKKIKIGDLIPEYVFKAKEKIGNEYLFSNPMISGVTFDILDVRHSWEVKYLIDSTRVVSSVTEAIKLLECVSRKSNQDGLDYIKANFNSAYESLYQRIVEFRQECQTNGDDFYNAYRLTNLINAFTAQNDDRTQKILLQELDSIQKFIPEPMTVENLKYDGISPLGEYLRYILRNTKDSLYHNELTEKYIAILNDQTTSAGIYFAYALSFDNINEMIKIEITDNNRNSITLGILNTALWYKYYWQKDKIAPLLAKIEEINNDPEITEYINKRFVK